ncbi:MAG TPA: magnesium-protoporphyrin IX monomethyl ester anaerobic oxidative cyclase [Armatimonadota bacterium]|jgi:anaerobic magnesium-protoporphyrin IX monomethyl ester cyclase
MRILLINPPHPAIGSRIPHEHLPPLGLLSVGGPLIDAGHDVHLLDAEFGPLSTGEIVEFAARLEPRAILLGHSGSTSGHPAAAEITRALRAAMPGAWIIYGGVFPTYHWREILHQEPQIDVIVRGEGEATTVRLMEAIETGSPIDRIPGIAFRPDHMPYATPPAAPIDLDAYRVGWELIDCARYSYWGDKRAVVVQFSRGCPHQCNYCGQRGFWTRWRHRDPRRFASEIAWLNRTRGVEVFNFADENPTASRTAWLAFLEALIAENVNVTLVGSTRADDIVRDADILHLYKQAGAARWLLGLENYDEETLKRIRKGGSPTKDRQAIQLLRQHNILSMATWVVGFEEETDRDYWRGLRQLLSYDPDQIQMLYATPHRWTPFYRQETERRVIQTDRRLWDYKHQVLAARHVPAWRTLLWVKGIELAMQLRPRALRRVLIHPDRPIRDAMRWYYRMGRKVWLHEVLCFAFRDRRVKDGPTLAEFWGEPQDAEEEALDAAPLRISLVSADVGGRPEPSVPLVA